MIKKIQMLETAESELAGGNMTADMRARFPRWLVRNVLATGYDKLLRGMFEQYQQGIFNKDQFLLDNYTVTYTPTSTYPVVVLFDEERKKWYFDEPRPIITLRNNEGIRLICPVTNEEGYGVPVTIGASPIRKSLTVSKINTRFTYYQERNRVWLDFPIAPIIGLMIKQVTAFSHLDDNDVVDVPGIMTKNGMFTVYEYVKQTLLTMPPTKQTENNSPSE